MFRKLSESRCPTYVVDKRRIPSRHSDMAEQLKTTTPEEAEVVEVAPKVEMPKFRYLNVSIGAGPPKHFGQAALRAAGSTVGGVIAGAGTLVAAPIIGAKQEGAKGLVKGLGVGVGAVLFLPVAGVVSGVSDLVRGAAATPGAMKGNVEGKEYDAVSKKWIHYSLEEDRQLLSEDAELELKAYLKLCAEEEAQVKEEVVEEKSVKETGLYDELGVQPTASEGQIKKAYYKMALKCHPDKNPGDEDAAARFQKLGDAYHILSDPGKRAKYDEEGAEGIQDDENAQQIDPATFFAMVFGSEQFEKFVGELQLASAMKMMEDDDHDIDVVEEDFRQRQRRTRIAVTLVDDVLAPYLQGDLHDTEFFDHVKTNIALDLVKSPYGATLVRALAYIYIVAADKYDGSAVKAAATRLKDVKHSASTRFDVASGAAKAFTRAKRASQAADNSEAASTEAQSTITVDGADLEDAAFAIVSDHHGKDFSVSFYRSQSAAATAYKKLSYTFASVLFERQDASGWKPMKAYGTSKATEVIKRAVESLDDELSHANLAAVVARNKEAEMQASVIEAAWRVTVLDVEATLRDATSKLFRDKSATEPERKKRAKALRILGKAFQKAADESGHPTNLTDVISKAGTPFSPPGDDDPTDDDP